ncbi:MAG: NAD(P)-binding domain-containing protein, partial [Nanoarchaeota archaeon]
MRTIAVVGLGYVGLPLAVALAKHFPIIGFDVNTKRIEELIQGEDRSGEVSQGELAYVQIEYSSDPAVLKRANFIIICVPTPIDKYNKPDLY